MSRRTFPIDDENYVVVGWDPPLNSFFWQVWNGKDEARMKSLEGGVLDFTDAGDELDALYAKYPQFGGEPIIADSGLGGKRITSVIELQQGLKEYAVIPAAISAALIRDSNE